MSGAHPIDVSAVAAPGSERAAFVRLTYAHLGLAVAAFVGVEWALLQIPAARDLAEAMSGGVSWLLVLVAFGVVSGLADRWARSGTSMGRQYLGLGLFVVAQAVLFLPLLVGLANQADDVLPTAAILTLLLAAGLTAVVAVTRTDFSFLRTALVVGGFVAFGLIVAAILFGVPLGLWFSLAMVAFAGGSILYHTSGVLRTYRTDQHVAAALSLFGSVALLFWYVVRVVASRRR